MRRDFMPLPSEKEILWFVLFATPHQKPGHRPNSLQAAYGLAKVLASRSEKWRVGDLVLASTGWREHAVLPADRVKPVMFVTFTAFPQHIMLM
jgi:NADPH-dependent curcumin reductase CurA